MALSNAAKNAITLHIALAERLLELKTAIESMPLKYSDEIYPLIFADESAFNAELAALPEFAHLTAGELANANNGFTALVAWGGDITDGNDPWAQLNKITSKPVGL